PIAGEPDIVSDINESYDIATPASVTITFAAGPNGSLTGPTGQTIFYGGSATPETAVPSAGYHFVNWTGTNGFVATTANPLTVTNVTMDMAITANFAADAVNGVCGTSNGGTFTVIPSTNLCATGTAGSITGTGPWNWTCSGSNGGTSANCSANIQTYTVTFNAGLSGTLTGTTSQTVPYGGSTTPVTAVPDTGFFFFNWTFTFGGFVTPLSNPLTVTNVTANMTVTAHYYAWINGACGSSSGQYLAIAPTTNLCATGTASAVTGTGPWSWTCSGSNGTTASCFTVVQGDANGDGKIDVSDALMVLRIAVGLENATADILAKADVAPLKDGKPAPDGVIDINDALLILKRAVGLVSW
ncbi:MAG: hypothetical protein ABSA86_07405, partial [Oryzomonas sp.]